MLDQAERLRQLMVNQNTRKGGPRIITVTSGKGGVGKSNIVVNLSIELQKEGKRVMIFDADIGMGNDDVLMGFMSRYNVFDVVSQDKDIEDVVLTGPFGVRLLPGGSGLTKIDDLTEKQREMFINKLNALTDLDYIIMDTGAGINRSVLGFISCSEEVIILTTPEPTSLTDAYSLLKVVNHFNIKSKAKVIVNRVLDQKEGQNTFDKFNSVVASFLNMKLEYLGCVSEDKRLVQAVRKQQPFVISYPASEAAKDIRKIVKKIDGSYEQEYGEGVQGLFKRLFNIFS